MMNRGEEEEARLAVAAAASAYAIQSHERSHRDDEERRGEEPDRNISIRSTTGADSVDKTPSPSTSIKKTPIPSLSHGPKKGNEGSATSRSFQRILTARPQPLVPTPGGKQESLRQTHPQTQPPSQPTIPKVPIIQPNVVLGSNKADIWEQKEMEKINRWFEGQTTAIEKWKRTKEEKENKKLKETEAKLEAQNKKAKEKHRSEIQKIEKKSKYTTNLAKKQKEKEEHNVRVKAKKYRETGRAPSMFWCF
ncbi:unnamed protein product [Cuscuta epithymum]|uniref:Remorin C-terminal domain-containing protein n=1 Tax=Cuscuta epithymum TaxID=186058 RepID=A0AAV0F862_9ASTE|nr:unnamed protein product [Cuscuta epithymum]